MISDSVYYLTDCTIVQTKRNYRVTTLLDTRVTEDYDRLKQTRKDTKKSKRNLIFPKSIINIYALGGDIANVPLNRLNKKYLHLDKR